MNEPEWVYSIVDRPRIEYNDTPIESELSLCTDYLSVAVLYKHLQRKTGSDTLKVFKRQANVIGAKRFDVTQEFVNAN